MIHLFGWYYKLFTYKEILDFDNVWYGHVSHVTWDC